MCPLLRLRAPPEGRSAWGPVDFTTLEQFSKYCGGNLQIPRVAFQHRLRDHVVFQGRLGDCQALNCLHLCSLTRGESQLPPRRLVRSRAAGDLRTMSGVQETSPMFHLCVVHLLHLPRPHFLCLLSPPPGLLLAFLLHTSSLLLSTKRGGGGGNGYPGTCPTPWECSGTAV